MNTTVQALLELYVARGGALTDSYDDIAGGAQVGNYTVIPDCVSALSKVGGSGETYETVAEIEVGEMFEYEGQYIAQTDIPFPTASESDTFYLNTTDNPNDGFMTDKGEVLGILWNCTGSEEGLVPIDPNKPYVACAVSDGKIALVSDTNDLSNTTVKILKKVSAPSGGGKFVVTITKTEEGGETVYTADKTIAECIAANEAGQIVVCSFEGQDIPLFLIEDGVIVFSITSLMSGTIASVMIQGIPDDGADTWDVVTDKKEIPDGLKPTKEFDFTAAPDGQGGFTVTAGDGVTYANILDAMASSPLVFAHISVPAIDTTVIARFNSKNSVSGNGNVTASIMGYFNGAYSLMELYVRSDGTNGVIVVPLAVQT